MDVELTIPGFLHRTGRRFRSKKKVKQEKRYLQRFGSLGFHLWPFLLSFRVSVCPSSKLEASSFLSESGWHWLWEVKICIVVLYWNWKTGTCNYFFQWHLWGDAKRDPVSCAVPLQPTLGRNTGGCHYTANGTPVALWCPIFPPPAPISWQGHNSTCKAFLHWTMAHIKPLMPMHRRNRREGGSCVMLWSALWTHSIWMSSHLTFGPLWTNPSSAFMSVPTSSIPFLLVFTSEALGFFKILCLEIWHF